MLKKIFFSCVVLLFSCAENLPEWYLNTPQNTETTIYGVGFAQNKEQAVQEALSNAKEKVYTSVSSSKFVQDMAINNTMANEYKSSISLKTPDVPIPDYEIVHIEHDDSTFYALISANKAKIAQEITAILEDGASQFRPKFLQFYSTADMVEKAFIIEDLYQKCKKHLEIEKFYSGLGFIFPDNICTEVYKVNYNLAIENTVEVISSNVKITPILLTIFAKKFTVAQNSKRIISYSTQFKTEEIGNTFITGLELSIMQSNTKKVYVKKCVGNSSVSQEKSIDAAIATCLAKANEQQFSQFFTE